MKSCFAALKMYPSSKPGHTRPLCGPGEGWDSFDLRLDKTQTCTGAAAGGTSSRNIKVLNQKKTKKSEG
jgi:hypothetical protein